MPNDTEDPRYAELVLKTRAEERARFKAILALPEAAGRLTLATTLITETDVTPEQAAEVLTSSGRSRPALAQFTAFMQAMSSVGNPSIIHAEGDHGQEG